MLPHFKLLGSPRRPQNPDIPSGTDSLCDAWTRAIEQHYPTASDHPPFTVIEGRFGELDPALLQCDCIVSPANSFGIMDGGFDLVLSEAFGGEPRDIWSLTNHCQNHIRAVWRGYIPPGACAIVPLPDNVAGRRNAWHTRALAILPTMRTPEDVSWHHDLVYNGMWALLAALARWAEEQPVLQIHTVLVTGIATGTGSMSYERCAQQMVLAMKHFQLGLPAHPRWDDVIPRSIEVDKSAEA